MKRRSLKLFPIVFLAGMGKKFNKQDVRGFEYLPSISFG